MIEIQNTYFKVKFGDALPISGSAMPDPAGGPYTFINCTFHPALDETVVQYYNAGSKFMPRPEKLSADPVIEVRFQYDEPARKWDPLVVGTSDPDEARKAFAAAVLTCQMLNPELLPLAKVIKTLNGHQIIPAV